MKTILTFALIAAFTFPALAQDTKTETKTSSDPTETVYTIVEKMPEFPGGEKAMSKYLIENISYPEKARKEKISGTVYVSFVVGSTGMIQDVKVLRGVHEDLDNEAVRVVKAMPAWKPGTQSGKAVSVQYNLPIKFTL